VSEPTFDLVMLQSLNGAELGVLRAAIPADEALAALQTEQIKALRGEYGAGVVVFLRATGENPNISELPTDGVLVPGASTPIERVFAAVVRERAWQDQKWGTIEQHPHEVGGWIALVRKELREAEDAWCTQRGDAGALEELLQVAATAVACIQQHGIVERSEMRGTE